MASKVIVMKQTAEAPAHASAAAQASATAQAQASAQPAEEVVLPKTTKKNSKAMPPSAMDPVISKIAEANNVLTFTIQNINVSMANGLRRIVSEIPAVIFRTSPHEKNNESHGF